MPNKNTYINLIESVKNHPKLFTNLARNTDDELKEWSAVAKQCKLSITEAQNEWNSLLMEYVEYLRNNEYFSLAENMNFLQPYFFTMLDDGNIDEEELSEAIDPKELEECNLRTSIQSTKNIKIEDSDGHEIPPKNLIEKSAPKQTDESNAVTQSSSFTNLSPMELIFLGYAKQLQKMPLTSQLAIKRKIADILDEAELQTMN